MADTPLVSVQVSLSMEPSIAASAKVSRATSAAGAVGSTALSEGRSQASRSLPFSRAMDDTLMWVQRSTGKRYSGSLERQATAGRRVPEVSSRSWIHWRRTPLAASMALLRRIFSALALRCSSSMGPEVAPEVLRAHRLRCP